MNEAPDTPRLPLLTSEEARAAADRIGIDPKYLTQPIWTMLLARPKYAKAIYAILTDLLFRSSLPVRLRELIIMRIGWATKAKFEWAQHWKVATASGIDPADIVAVRNWIAEDRFSESDRAVFTAVDEVIADGVIGDETWIQLTVHFDEPLLLELVAVIATWHYVSVLVRTLQVPLDDGMEDWPPDGRIP